ncbi:MAG TPA: hypothetical protein VHM30_11280, partial [Gemmatimonadaceae bacterium]|nr:hypothetical protein [Gemmatimonadaceae bacterium]
RSVTASLALGAGIASAQSFNVDSLAGVLSSTNSVRVRAEVVGRLNALPLAELTPAARSALVRLLDAEADHTLPGDPQPIAEGDEVYDEYVVDLAGGVLRLDDPASLRAMTRVGLQTSHDVQRWVASFGAQSLPHLDAVWAEQPAERPVIVTTWAFMLGVTGPDALVARDRQRVLTSIMGAAEAYPIAFAGAARVGSLVTLVPSLSQIAASSPSEIARNRAAYAAQLLAPARDALTPAQMLAQTLELARGFCVRPGEGNDARANVHPNRPAACGKVRGALNRARAALGEGRTDDARTELQSAASVAEQASTDGVFTAVEAAAVRGNVEYLLARI